MALPRDVYDLAIAVKRAADDAKTAIERTPLPVLATCLSRWEDMHWSKTNPVVTNWLNDWALQCREAQGGSGPNGPIRESGS